MPKLIDRTGQKFNRLTFIEYKGNRRWLCKCDCGNSKIINGTRVSKGLTKSCGCYDLDLKRSRKGLKNPAFNNIANKTFNYLTALAYSGNSKWRFRCKCGNVVEKLGYRVVSGHTKSCGCYNIELCIKERVKLMNTVNIKHNHTSKANGKSLTYLSWGGMKSRCYNKNHPRYNDWGGRGIEVCDRWKGSFENFLEDMRERPKGRTIDRIDNSKGYYKKNCRWATPTQQQRNTKSNRMITYKGETHCIVEWAEITGINKNTLYGRLYKNLTIEKVFEVKK